MNLGIAVVMIVVALVVAALILTPLVIAGLRVARRRRTQAATPQQRGEAVVVGKRTGIAGSGQGATEQVHFVTFQLPDGQRLELQVPGHESGVLVPGDEGDLQWQGNRYLGFARVIMR